jgi:acyl CoA:acetate/3-ketoacid CoA transferase alpha subunit
MVIDKETRRTIIDLHSSQHKNIRQITKITRKSSRDITAILKEGGIENQGHKRMKSMKKIKALIV